MKSEIGDNAPNNAVRERLKYRIPYVHPTVSATVFRIYTKPPSRSHRVWVRGRFICDTDHGPRHPEKNAKIMSVQYCPKYHSRYLTFRE